jgi:hypothetical protein
MKEYLHILAALLILIILLDKANAQNFDSISFEMHTSKIIIDSAGNIIWEIGTPDKIFFNSAYSGTKAILTDSISSYPPNDTSVFIYVIRNPYTSTCYTSMEFWHKYDMDTLNDIGIIDASYDGGNSWIVVNDTNNVMPWSSEFWWDYDYHESNGNTTVHPLTITGKSDGWIQSRFNWQWWFPLKSDTIIYPPDSLMIRFTFISDSVETYREGWMIDDIVTVSASMQNCSAIDENSADINISLIPNPFSLQTTIRTEYHLKNSTLIVYNSFGQKAWQIDNISGQSVTVLRNGLPPGLYFLQLSEKGKLLATKKIIITD